MIIHLFNSALVSGPETLVIPSLPLLYGQEKAAEVQVGFLSETRRASEARAPVQYARSFGLDTFELPVRGPLDPGAVKALAWVLAQRQPTLVHAHDVKASVYLAAATYYMRARRKSELSWKLVSTHHGVHARSGAKVKAYEQVYRRFALKRFDAALTVCSSDRDILLASGLEPRRVFVHLNGVDRPALGFADRIARQAEVRSAWVSDLGLELEGKVVFGVVARLAAEKNHDLLLRSLAHLRAQGKGDPNWVCICFGTGPLDQELREKTHALGLEKNLRWAGYRARLSEEMAGFDFLVSLSKGEGLPINLLEAGWARTPILATAVDGVQDLLPAHQPEWAFSRLPATADPALITEFIQRLISDPDLRLSLSNALFERTRSHFSGLAWRARLLEIYQDIHKFI